MVFRMAWVLPLVIAVIGGGGANSAAIGEEGNNGDAGWPAGISPLDSLAYWRNDGGAKQTPEADDDDDKRACCVPKLWTGQLFIEARLEKPGTRITYRYVQVVYFDQANKRLAGDVVSGNRTAGSYILLFNKTGATQYTFSRTAKWCNKRFLAGAKIRPLCIPSNATLLRSFSLGAGGGALKTQTWGYRYTDRRVDSAVSLLVTPGNCIPVISAVATTFRGSPKKRSTQLNIGTLFTDIKTNIAGKSVFTPPAFCKKAEGEEGEEQEQEGGEEDRKLYFDHHDPHINTIIESFVAVP